MEKYQKEKFSVELLKAVKCHFYAKKLKNEALLRNYFENPAGIGEHPDIIEECCKIVDSIAEADDGIRICEETFKKM